MRTRAFGYAECDLNAQKQCRCMTLWVGIRGTISMIWKSRTVMRKCCLSRIQRLMANPSWSSSKVRTVSRMSSAILREIVEVGEMLPDFRQQVGRCPTREITRVAFGDYVESLFCGRGSVMADMLCRSSTSLFLSVHRFPHSHHAISQFFDRLPISLSCMPYASCPTERQIQHGPPSRST